MKKRGLFGVLMALGLQTATASASLETSSMTPYIKGLLGYGLAYDNNADQRPDGWLAGLGAGISVYGGFGLELDYQWFQSLETDAQERSIDTELLSLGVTYQAPLYRDFSWHAKLGAAYWMIEKNDSSGFHDANGLAPLLGLGIGYDLNASLSTRLSYQYLHALGDRFIGEFDSHAALLSLAYSFGRSGNKTGFASKNQTKTTQAPPAQTTPASSYTASGKLIPACAVMEQSILFNFNSHDLDDSKVETIRDFIAKIRKSEPDPDNLAFELVGYTDSLGSEAYNLRLSNDRLDAIESTLAALDVRPWRIITAGIDNSFWRSNNEKRRVDIRVTNITHCH